MSFPFTEMFEVWCGMKGLDVKAHQVEGIDWVMERELNPSVGPAGGFICDEMGLGKTILTIATMILHPKGPEQKTLIVLPKSLLEQWEKAVLRFTGVQALIYHGAQAKNIGAEELDTCRIVITTYGMIATRKVSEGKPEYTCKLWEKNWSRIIYDEAHYLRNHNTGVFKGAKKLKADIKWMVTGTPINNRVRDFYNECVIQGVGSTFSSKVSEIKAIIEEVVLKRTKKETGIIMPKLNEHIVEVEWKSKEEERFVRNIHSLMSFVPVTTQNVDNVIRNLGTMTGQGITWLMLMRQSCVLPVLAQRALQKRAYEAGYDASPISSGLTDSKLSCVVDTVINNKNSGKGKLIFCMFRAEMEYLKKELWMNGLGSAVINGSTTKKQRRFALQNKMDKETRKIVCQKLKNSHEHILDKIDSFLKPEVLIAQIQTCCEGLNLQHFAEVYFTTPHWNPAVEDQAVARAHRIGQKQEVDVYRFMTTFKEPTKNDTIRHHSKFDSSVSLDQYCIEIQKKKREKARECGL
jgi:SNF2 family DNA or RNA helicase